MAERCAAMVWDRGFWHRFPCSRTAVEVVNGKHYCKQHAKIERKSAASPAQETSE